MRTRTWYSAVVLLSGGILFNSAAADFDYLPASDSLYTLPMPNPYASITGNDHAPRTLESELLRTEAWQSVTYRTTSDQDNNEPVIMEHYELIKPLPPPDNSMLAQGLNAIFVPEEFHMGRATVSCSITTAIKRKNPLCLLNPLVLNVSW